MQPTSPVNFARLVNAYRTTRKTPVSQSANADWSNAYLGSESANENLPNKKQPQGPLFKDFLEK